MDEHTPRTILLTSFKKDGIPIHSSRLETPEEVNERILRKKTDKAREIYKENHTTPLNCNKCGEYICETYEFDLNSSKFYHKKCLNK